MLDLGSLDLYVLLREVMFSPYLPLPSPVSNCILLGLRHGQIFPMRHRSNGREYI